MVDCLNHPRLEFGRHVTYENTKHIVVTDLEHLRHHCHAHPVTLAPILVDDYTHLLPQFRYGSDRYLYIFRSSQCTPPSDLRQPFGRISTPATGLWNQGSCLQVAQAVSRGSQITPPARQAGLYFSGDGGRRRRLALTLGT
jgi:hypothetical protein